MSKLSLLAAGGLALTLTFGCSPDSGSRAKSRSKRPEPFARELNPEHVAVLKAHGDVTDLAELHDYFAVKQPDSTPIYGKTEVHSSSSSFAVDVARLGNWDPNTSPALAKEVLEKREDVLALVDQAVEMERPSWVFDWSNGFHTDFHQNNWLSKLGQLLMIRANYKVSQGDLNGALDDYKKLDKLVQHVTAYHDTIGIIAAELLERRDFIYRLIEQNKDDKQALAKIRDTVENRPPLISFHHTLFGAAADCIHAMEDDARYAKRAGGPQVSSMRVDKLIRQQAGDECLMRAAEIYQAADAMKGTDDYSRVQLMLYLHELEMDNYRTPVAYLVRSAFSTEMNDTLNVFLMLIRRRHQILAIRLAEERLRLGQWPQELPDWGDVTRDPFSQLQFGYKRLKQGIVFYSYGPDRMDDGGKPWNKEMSGDMVVRLNFD